MKLEADFNALKKRNVVLFYCLYVCMYLCVIAFNNQIRFKMEMEFNLPPGQKVFQSEMHSQVEENFYGIASKSKCYIYT